MDVLLIEPEPAMSAVLQSVLESRGHTVTAVTDGESGLERYQSQHFPIVILDWQLPEMDGLNVCRKIRSSPKGADSLILMITLRTNPGDLKQILAAGADDYLAKPVDKLLFNIRLAIAEQRASNLMLQRKAEESRTRAQAMLQLVLNTIPSRVFWKNKESRYLGCNRLFALDAGLKDPSQIVGKTDHDLCWAEQAQLYLSDDRAVMQSGLPKVNYEEHQATPDGESMYLETSKIPLKDRKGNLIGVMGTYQDITKRKEAEAEILALNLSLEEQVRERTKELLAKEEQLHETLALNDSILMTSALGIAAYRQNGQCVMANPSLAAIAGITQEQLLNQNFRQLGSWQTSGIQEAAESVLATGAKVELDIRSLTSFFGHDVWMRCRLSRFTSRGEPHLLLMLENITEKKAAEEELRLAASVYQNSSEGILVTDAAGIILSVNPAFTEITGYTEDEARGKKTSLLRSDRQGPEFYHSMWETLTKEGCWRGEIWNRRKDGEVYLEWLSINRIEASDGAPFRYVAVFHDITELRRKDEEIRHQAFHDALTGLPNRALMKDRLLLALERSKREGGRLAVIFIDLDRFKAINDGLGHDVGDLLLQEVARRIKSRMRTVDTVARLGGEEFVVLMEDLRDAGDSASLAQELIAEIARPMELSGHAVEISASMGMAFYPEDGAKPLELMKCADLAMYAAKSAGRNTYRFFQQDMQDRISQRLSLEMELRVALAQRDLELHYQPKVDLATGNILGVEALLRWRHPLRGLLLPADFIPLAEECGLICELGDWVLDEVCHQSAVWQAAGHTFKIAFNISPHQLEMGDLVARISELTALHGIAPSDLEIELTESAVMAYSIHAASVLARLRGIGVTVAVSDFCAGYSSLSYLRKLPIDILKINHSFVTDADNNAEDAQIVKTILSLGRMFKLTMEAEGIETSHQAELLKSFGCGIAQGYFFSRPLPAREFEDWLDAAIDASGRKPNLE
ncbi:MAG: EAL domain-containing protein [Gammaproteobacteria bacterium]|nr:EAL domain-containing protein [Gammaproteobacteria bacterium]